MEYGLGHKLFASVTQTFAGLVPGGWRRIPDEPELWDLPRFVEEVFTASPNRERKASVILLLITDFMKNQEGMAILQKVTRARRSPDKAQSE